jgi:hypothetical protein
VATAAVWNQFVPTLEYAGAGSISAGTVGFGTGNDAGATGRWMQIGKRIDLSYLFKWGGLGNGGAGVITTQMPPGVVSRLSLESHIHCHLYVNDPQSGITWNFLGDAYIPPNSSQIHFEFPAGQNDCTMGAYVISADGNPGTGTPNIPAGFPVGGVLTINGAIEVQ